MEPIISIRMLNHFYGSGRLRRQVLFDITTDVYPGEIVILTGPSGSGKTTLLTLAGALRSVEEGSVIVLGEELNGAARSDLIRIRENIGFIFQSHNLIDSLTAQQNVQMSLGVGNSLSHQEIQERAAAMLAEVGLADFLEHLPTELSGGQRQRVAIARALVRQPKIILADEPTAALDRKSGREVVELLHKLAKAQGCAILLVTHDNRILDIADRILTLEDGRITSFTAGLLANTGRLLSAFAQLHRKGDLVRHVARLSDRQFLDLVEQISTEFEKFLEAIELGNQEAAGALLDQVLEAVSVKVRELLNADRGTIFLVDEKGTLREATIGLYDDGKTVQSDGGAGYRTHSILTMPIYDRNKSVFAVVQLQNKRDGREFNEQDEEKFRQFAEPLGLILESCLRLTRLSRFSTTQLST